jgi:hypothetical protein
MPYATKKLASCNRERQGQTDRMRGVAAATNDAGQIQAQGAMRIHIVHRDVPRPLPENCLMADVSNPLDIFSQNISHPIALLRAREPKPQDQRQSYVSCFGTVGSGARCRPFGAIFS